MFNFAEFCDTRDVRIKPFMWLAFPDLGKLGGFTLRVAAASLLGWRVAASGWLGLRCCWTGIKESCIACLHPQWLSGNQAIRDNNNNKWG